MKMKIADRWVKALRSGKYKQGRGSLNKGGHYCCLGVLCEVLGISPEKRGSFIAYDGEIDGLPKSAMEKAGMRCEGGTLKKKYKGKDGNRYCALADLNDMGGLSFKQLANIIEKNYKDL